MWDSAWTVCTATTWVCITLAAALSTGDTSKTTVPYQEVPFVKYLENPTEASWNIPRWLIKHGYTDEEIIKVLGGNAIRVLREVWS